MTIKKQLDNLIIKKQVGFEIDLNREPAILIAWIFENNPTQI